MTEIIELKDIATEINTEHEIVVKACKSAVEHAMKAGGLLIQAKSMVNHGQWLTWLKDNFTFSERTAQAYMKISREYPKLKDSKAKRVADLPMRAVLKLLADPRQLQHLRILRLDGKCELSTNLPDGRLIIISPSAKHPGYYFVDCANLETGIVEGWTRPVLMEYISAALDVLNVPPEIPWSRDNDAEPRDEARWKKKDYPDRVANCVKLGIMPGTTTCN